MRYSRFVSPLNPVNLPLQRCAVSRKDASQRILIMRLGSNGDILMATPLLAALRQIYPDAFITWMVEHTAHQAIDANPYVDEILVWNGGSWKRMLRKYQHPLWLARAASFLSQMRRRRFDVFFTFHAEQWPSVAWAAAAPQTIGVHGMFPQFDIPNEFYRKFYTTFYVREDLPLHHTDIYLLPLRALGQPPPETRQMSLGYTREDDKAVDDFLAAHSPGGDAPLVLLAPKTTWETRCWPEERFVALGNALTRRPCRIVLIGSPTEQEPVERIASQMTIRPMTAAGALSFRQVAAFIARASLVVSGDTGPMHVAAAVGTPYLALFGPTPVKGRAPLAGRGLSLFHSVPCGPCDFSLCRNEDNPMLCMRLLTTEEVLEAAESLLA